MSLAPGTRVGSYEIRALLGVGGMGEVYRAVDLRLGREVAIKFLPETVATDPARHARFEREAQTLATLNHPHIAQIYGLHDNALVMELLDGVPLAARIAEGALPVRKAIDYAVQIARGLAAAHDRGIVHRDLKPDNVFVLKDGHVKIIDFGLARGRDKEVPADALTATSVQVRTDPGTVMGTVGYMAPEQVRGEALDARADLFALGAVLYEMLTGQRAFKRETAAETMTAILREDPPDLATARPDIPPALDRIVRHSLEKNPVERFQTARDIAFALDSLSTPGSGASVSGVTAVAPTPVNRAPRERPVWFALSVVLAGVAVYLAMSRGQQVASTAARASGVAYRSIVPLPDGLSIPSNVESPLRLAVSPDGRRVAYVRLTAGGGYALWEYSFDTGATRLLPGTEGATAPVWSRTDGRLLFNVGSQLKLRDEQGRVSVIPGLSYGYFVDSGEFLGMAGTPGRWLLKVIRQPGGAPEPLLDPRLDGENYVLPSTVPGTNLFLVQHRVSNGDGGRQLELGSLDGETPTVLLSDATTPFVLAGHLLFARGDRVYAQPIDLAARRLTGSPTLLAEHVDISTLTGAAYSVSDPVLVYMAAANSGLGRITVMTRDGTVVSTHGDEAPYSNLELSPDGKRLAVSVTDSEVGGRDIFVFDLARGVRQRLTADPSDERSAVWTRDGRSIVYNSRRLDLFLRPSDFSNGERPLLEDQISKDPRDVSPDGTQLLYRHSGAGTSNDLWAMSLTGDPKPHAVLATAANENYGSYSPDGQSIIYVSDESGRAEVYTMSLAGGSKTQVSTAGGSFPRWRQPQEIVYLAPDRTLMRVPVQAGTFGVPVPLFQINPLEGFGAPFDITPDGQRIIVNAVMPSKLPPSLNLIVNWQALLH